MNQVPVDGRNTAASVFPSLSKSAGIGTSPLPPNGNAKKLLSSLLITNQFPFDGRKTATSALPSPVKSPGTGMSAGTPNVNAETLLVELFAIHHSALPAFERKIEMSVLPSPSKSKGELLRTDTSLTCRHTVISVRVPAVLLPTVIIFPS